MREHSSSFSPREVPASQAGPRQNQAILAELAQALSLYDLFLKIWQNQLGRTLILFYYIMRVTTAFIFFYFLMNFTIRWKMLELMFLPNFCLAYPLTRQSGRSDIISAQTPPPRACPCSRSTFFSSFGDSRAKVLKPSLSSGSECACGVEQQEESKQF